MLRMRAETPHHHVVLHPPAQRVDGCLRGKLVHGELLLLKELHARTPTQQRPKPQFIPLRHTARPSREAGSCKLSGAVVIVRVRDLSAVAQVLAVQLYFSPPRLSAHDGPQKLRASHSGKTPFMGEFGANEQIPLYDRVKYQMTVRLAFDTLSIGMCAWGYTNTFPLWDQKAKAWVPGMRAAMGLKEPMLPKRKASKDKGEK